MTITDDCPRYTYRDAQGTMLGYLQLYPDGEIAQVYVKPEHRRRGIATALYAYACALVPTRYPQIRHSPDRTIDGQLWARAVGGALPTWVGC